MFDKGILLQNKRTEKIKELEKQQDIKLSKLQKILLTSSSPITNILDALYGEVMLFILDQNLKSADKQCCELLDVDEGDEIFHRNLIVHKHGRPLISAMSLIPTSRCSDEVVEDLLKKDIPTGAIIYRHNIETMLRVTRISIEKPTPLLKELFKTDEDMLIREYVLIHHGKLVTWTKEGFPISYYQE